MPRPIAPKSPSRTAPSAATSRRRLSLTEALMKAFTHGLTLDRAGALVRGLLRRGGQWPARACDVPRRRLPRKREDHQSGQSASSPHRHRPSSSRVAYPAPFAAADERSSSVVELARAARRGCRAARRPARSRRLASRWRAWPRLPPTATWRSSFLRTSAGYGASVAEIVLGNLALATGDASLALVVAMHARAAGPSARRSHLARGAVRARLPRGRGRARSGVGALINSLATEPEMGSPEPRRAAVDARAA